MAEVDEAIGKLQHTLVQIVGSDKVSIPNRMKAFRELSEIADQLKGVQTSGLAGRVDALEAAFKGVSERVDALEEGPPRLG